MPDVRLAYAPASSGASLPKSTAQGLPTGTSSGSRSPFFSIHLFVPLATSLLQSLNTVHRVSWLVAAHTLPQASSRPLASRLRIVGTSTHRALPSIHSAAQAREPRRARNAQPQRTAALAQSSAVPISCEPPGAPAIGSFSVRTLPYQYQHTSTASLTPACSGLAALAADARR